MLLNWVLEKTLESPLDCKEIQLVHPKGNQSEYPLKGLMLKLKLQYFGHLIRRKDIGKARDAGKGDNRGWDGCMASLTQWIWVWVSSGSWWWTGKPGMLQSMESQRVRHHQVTEMTKLSHGFKAFSEDRIKKFSSGKIHHELTLIFLIHIRTTGCS